MSFVKAFYQLVTFVIERNIMMAIMKAADTAFRKFGTGIHLKG
jgi:hypothetical protein